MKYNGCEKQDKVIKRPIYLSEKGVSLDGKLVRSLSDVKKGDVIEECRSARIGIVVEVRSSGDAGIVYDTLYISRTKLIRQIVRERDLGWVLKVSASAIRKAKAIK